MLDIYWKQINPTQSDGQFTDIGPSYRAAIFVANDEEKRAAEESKENWRTPENSIHRSRCNSAMKFYPAEDYHQEYYRQNPEHFEAFENGSGRTSFHEKKSGDKP